jgi:hypothetical protein
LLQNLKEVIDIGEILHDGIQNDGIETEARKIGEIISRFVEKADLRERVCLELAFD